MKKLREGGGGEWELIKLDPGDKTADELLREIYMSDGWAEATEEEYDEALEPEEVVEEESSEE